MKPAVVRLVARTVALRASGLTPTKAAQLAAAEANPGFPFDAEKIAVDRKRLRDRLK